MKSDWTLEQFMHWWIQEREFRPPLDCPLSFDGAVYGIVLYRGGPFQVELFVMPPDLEVSDHVHPNVDSYEIYFSGQIAIRKRGEFETVPADWEVASPDGWLAVAGRAIEIARTDAHGGFIGPQGGCFLSVQKWHNGVAPTSVGNDWSFADAEQRAKSFVKEQA